MQDIWLGCKLSSLLRFVLDLNQSGLKHSSLPSTSFKFIFTTTIHFFAGKTRRCALDVTVYLIVCGARCHQGTPVRIHAWVLYGCRYQCVPRAQALLSPNDKLQWHSRYNFLLKSPLSKTDTFATATKCSSQRGSNKPERVKKRQGPTLGVRFIDVSFKREWTVNKDQV